MQGIVTQGNYLLGYFSYIDFDDTVFRFDSVWWEYGFLAMFCNYSGSDSRGIFYSYSWQFGSGGRNIFCSFFRSFYGICVLGNARVEIFLILYLYFDGTCVILDNAFGKETTKKAGLILDVQIIEISKTILVASDTAPRNDGRSGFLYANVTINHGGRNQ